MDVAQPGDTDAIAILRRAAAETGRVSPAVASVLSRRALDLTPPGDPGRGPLTAETLAYLIYAGKAADAVALMTAAAGDFADPAAEAEAGSASPTSRCSTGRPTSSSSASGRWNCPTYPRRYGSTCCRSCRSGLTCSATRARRSRRRRTPPSGAGERRPR